MRAQTKTPPVRAGLDTGAGSGLLAEQLLVEAALADHGPEGSGFDLVLPIVWREVYEPNRPAMLSAIAAVATAIVPEQHKTVPLDDFKKALVSAD